MTTNKDKPETIAEYAQAYDDLGWGVLVVYRPTDGGCSCAAGTNCHSPGKHPMGGPNNPVTPAYFPASDWAKHNVGLTPYTSDPKATPPFFVLDVDDKPGQGGGATLKAWVEEHGPLPDTPVARTGSGLHFFFKHPEGKLTNKVRALGAGIDVRARGGFVVAPPSLHASGARYEWLQGPWDTDLAAAPGWLLELLQGGSQDTGDFWDNPSVSEALAQLDDIPLSARKTRAEAYLRNIPPAYEGRGGDEQTLKAASVGHSFGLTIDDYWDLLCEYNEKCKPPWDLADLKVKAENAYQYNDRPFGWRLAESESLKTETLETAKREGKTVLQAATPEAIALQFIEDKGGEDHIRAVEDGFFVYDPARGIWDFLSKSLARGEIQQYTGCDVFTDKGELKRLHLPPRKRDEALDWALHHLPIMDYRFRIDPPQGAPFADGFVRVCDGEIEVVEHAPEHRAVVAFPYETDGDAEGHDLWVGFLRELFKGDADCDDKINALQEFVGACVLGVAPRYSRCVVLTGEGLNGKSTFMDIIKAVFPEDMTAASSPSGWSGPSGGYNISMLQNKRINIVNEIPEKLLAVENFKHVITGEAIMARNPYEKPYVFTPRCGHMLSANELPATIDNSHGFWRRFLVIPFNRNFGDLSKDKFQTKEYFVDRFLPHRGAILLWALEGATRLISNKGYTLPESHGSVVETWRLTTDAVADFVYSCCEMVEGDEGSLKSLYRFFKVWAKEEERKSIGKHKFSARLEKIKGVWKQRNAKGVHFNVVVRPMDEWKDYSGPKLVAK